MVRLLGLNSRAGGVEVDGAAGGGGGGPREISKSPNTSGDSGWLIRFFDSAFFCEWIAISYLYKHEHSGVRDYLCNRMYTLPVSGIESYLFQLCYMVLRKPSPALDKYVVDMCSKSLRIAIKIYWFLLAESEDAIDGQRIQNLQERCQTAALNGDWPPLVKPVKSSIVSPGAKNRMFKLRRLLSTSSPPTKEQRQQQPPLQQQPVPIPHVKPATIIPEEELRETEAGNRGPSDDAELSLKGLKKFMPGTKVREAFLKKFREKEDEDGSGGGDRPKDAESESFFRRLFREKEDEDRAVRSSDDFNSPDGFFRRFFRDKTDSEDRIGNGRITDEEKDGFFRKLFRDKSEDRDRSDRSDSRERAGDDDEKSSVSWEDDEAPEFSLFRRFFKVHPEDEERSGLPDGIIGTPEKSGESPSDSFFKKFFKDRSVDDTKVFGLRREDGTGNSPSSFLKRLFKDRIDEDSVTSSLEGGDSGSQNQSARDEENGFDRPGDKPKDGQVFPINGYHHHPQENGDVDGWNGGHATKPAAAGKFFDPAEEFGAADVPAGKVTRDESEGFAASVASDGLASRDEHLAAHKPASEFGSLKDTQEPGSPPLLKSNSFRKLSGSPLKKPGRTFAKPPLPRPSTFKIRKGTYHATVDFVQSLCDMSTGLADVFPMEDRRISLHESLQELNAHLEAAESDGGVCFPMGKGLCRVVQVPETEAVLLNSREKAPFLVCVEVLRCDTQRSEIGKDGKETILRKRSGIPLANGDLQFPRPPPWAFPTWNHPLQHPNAEQWLRTASKAIDLALAQSLDSKLKVVDVTLSVKQRDDSATPDSTNLRTRENGASDSAASLESDVESRSRDALDADCRQGMLPDIESKGVEDVSQRENDSKAVVRQERAANGEEEGNSSPTSCQHASADESFDTGGWISVVLTSVAGLNMDDVEPDPPPARSKVHRRVPSTIAMAAVSAAAAKGEAPAGLPVNKGGSVPSETQAVDKRGMNAKATDALAGELWEHKKERIRRTSKYGGQPDWDLSSMIVKSGDDCRQEHLAVQLIAQFYDIFQEAGLPLWLRPYEVLVTSAHTALIETIPDTASIHSIKSRNSNLCNLREFFCKKYVEKSPEFAVAQRNFVESMAGYSILCYILQVKDRHNGNLLVDEEGHIIHIDFGFMLSNSPGNVNFESAPFKLTRELLEVMDSNAEGTASEFFDYYKILCIQGFLLCRKHAERIILLVEMMQDSGCPCFKGGPRTLQNLRKRFHLTLTEQQCVALVLSLIDNSLDAWRSRQYDYYQRVLNGIL